MIFILVEEQSIEPVIKQIILQIRNKTGKAIEYQIRPHQGKQDLEKSLPKVLPTLSKQPNSSILIIRDQDSGDCKSIKSNINNIVNDIDIKCDYKIRIACTEMENWLLGDLNAIGSAFPRFNINQYSNKPKFSKSVDSIINPINELIKIIPEYKGRKNISKVENAKKISQYLDIENNYSKSFNETIKALEFLIK